MPVKWALSRQRAEIFLSAMLYLFSPVRGKAWVSSCFLSGFQIILSTFTLRALRLYCGCSLFTGSAM